MNSDFSNVKDRDYLTYKNIFVGILCVILFVIFFGLCLFTYSYYFLFKLPQYPEDIKEIIIKNERFTSSNNYKGDFVIESYPLLEKIVVKEDMLKNMNMLKICNNEKLRTIEIEDGAFENVKNLIIESIFK